MKKILIAISLLLLVEFAMSQESPSGLFESDEILEIELITDIAALQDDRAKEVEYHPATLRYQQEGVMVEVASEIRARGNFRKQPQVCEFPPLKLKFGRQAIRGTIFAGQPELKMVSHCQGDIFVVREYLLYRAYDILADYCLKVRPLKVTYTDSRDSFPAETHFAFFLEHQDVAQHRMGGQIIEDSRLLPHQINEDNLTTVALFSWMIGNTDWDVTLEKNLRVIQVSGKPAPYIIPYDFDWSAAVGAPYVGLGDTYDRRLYRGLCIDERRYRQWVSHVLIRKELVLDLYQEFDGWPSRRDRREAIEYLQESFRLLETNGGLPYYRTRCEEIGTGNRE